MTKTGRPQEVNKGGGAAPPKTELVVVPAARILTEPKEMGLDDQRLIFARLNEVYLDRKSGYSGDWTDRKVGVDMGVPRAWVEEVRERFFGPARSNEEMAELLAEAAPIRAEMKVLAEEARAHLARAASLAESVKAFDRRIEKIEKALL